MKLAFCFFFLYQLKSAPSFWSIFRLSQTIQPYNESSFKSFTKEFITKMFCVWMFFFGFFFLMQSKKSRPAIVTAVKLWLNNKPRDDTHTPYFHRRLLFISGPEGDKAATGVTRHAQATCCKRVTAHWWTASRAAPLDVFPVVKASSLPALLSDLPAMF